MFNWIKGVQNSFTINNVSVAKAHNLNNKFVGYCIAKAALFAMVLNTIAVPLGLASSAWMMSHNLFMTVGVGVAGIILALILDGMTVAAADRYRNASQELRELSIKNARVAASKKTAEVLEIEKQERGLIEPFLSNNRLQMAVFSVLSAAAGDSLWKIIFANALSLSIPFVNFTFDFSWIVGLSISTAVSLVLISCRIYKFENDANIADCIESESLMNRAVLADVETLAVKELQDHYRKQAQLIGTGTKVIELAVEGHTQNVYDRLLLGGRGDLSKAIKQERNQLKTESFNLQVKEEKAKAELDRLTAEQLAARDGQVVEGTIEEDEFEKGKFTDAIAAVLDLHPNWKNARVAREVGCSHTTVTSERRRLQSLTDNVVPFKREA
jgi:hypothetical protein